MNNLNTLPIEMFLDKARIAIKSNQKNLTLDIKEIQALSDSLAVTMTRLAGSNNTPQIPTPETLSIKLDGGKF
jgi:hypothetical protein